MNHRRLLPAAVLALVAAAGIAAPAAADILPLDAEISIGREAAQFVEAQFPMSTDALLLARVQRIGRRIAGVCGRPDLPFSFKVVDTPDINAFCLPGGFVYVFRGLLQGVPDDDALAFILAHEIAHAVHRHALRQFEKSQIVRVITAPLTGIVGTFGRDLANLIISRRFSRDDERQADRDGLLYAVRAGFGSRGGVKGMEILLALAGRSRHPEFLMSHPDTKGRKRAMEALAAQLENVQTEAPTVAVDPPADPVWPVPPPPSVPASHFPLAIGDGWTYQIRDAEGHTTKATVRVVEEHPLRRGGIFRVATEYPGEFSTSAWVTTTASGVLTRPVGDGDRWHTEWTWDPSGGTAVQGKVTVPAGEFTCIRVIQAGEEGAPLAEGWFAEGLGLVKAVWHRHGLTQELVSYSAAPRAGGVTQALIVTPNPPETIP